MAGAIVAVPRGGSSRLNGPSPWEAPRRPFSLYNFNSRVDDFVSAPLRARERDRKEHTSACSLSFFLFPSFPPFPFFFSLLQSGHRCSQTTAARPPGCFKPIEQKITYGSSALVATQSSRVSHPAGLLTKCQRILYPKLLYNTIDTAL